MARIRSLQCVGEIWSARVMSQWELAWKKRLQFWVCPLPSCAGKNCRRAGRLAGLLLPPRRRRHRREDHVLFLSSSCFDGSPVGKTFNMVIPWMYAERPVFQTVTHVFLLICLSIWFVFKFYVFLQILVGMLKFKFATTFFSLVPTLACHQCERERSRFGDLDVVAKCT